MRFVFLIILVANVAALAYGQGFFGVPPSEEGRAPRQLSERNQQAITLGSPRLVGQTP